MGYVPEANLLPLYVNANPGNVASSAALTQAVQALAETVNGNFDALTGLISASTLSRLGVVNVTDFGAKGDWDGSSGTDNTNAFQLATSSAVQNKGELFVPSGIYLVKSKLFFDDNGVSSLRGNGKDKTIILFDIQDDFAIEVGSYYSRMLKISDITIKLLDNSRDVGGVKVTRENKPVTWGSGCSMVNVDITNFSTTSLLLVESFGCKFTGCNFTGATRDGNNVATIVKLTRITTFTNVIEFDNCLFFFGKIGLQNLGASACYFNSCTFESLDLFHHIQQISGVSMHESFESCWFENITKGILNASINEVDLTPITPVVNRANVALLRFAACMVSSGVVSTVLNSTIEPYRVANFTFLNGFSVTTSTPPTVNNFTYNNGQSGTVTTVRTIDRTFDISTVVFPDGVYKFGPMLLTVESTGYNNQKMRAVYVTSSYRTDIVIQGTIQDTGSIGDSYKIELSWIDATNLRIRTTAQGLTAVAIRYSVI